jgi:hypothetical protein
VTALTTSLPVIPPAQGRRSCTLDDPSRPASSDGRHVRAERLGDSPESSERIPSDTKGIECLRRSSEARVRFVLARCRRAQSFRRAELPDRRRRLRCDRATFVDRPAGSARVASGGPSSLRQATADVGRASLAAGRIGGMIFGRRRWPARPGASRVRSGRKRSPLRRAGDPGWLATRSRGVGCRARAPRRAVGSGRTRRRVDRPCIHAAGERDRGDWGAEGASVRKRR